MTSKIFRKGKLASSGGGGSFVTIKPDEAVTLAPLVGIEEQISVDLHSWWDINPAPHLVCLGSAVTCPSCKLGDEAKLKSYLPVVLEDGSVKTFSYGISIERQLETIEDELGSLKGVVLKVKRTGSGFSTKYQVIPIGKTIDVSKHELPDIIGQLGVVTWEEQAEILENAGLEVPSATKKGVVASEEVAEGWDEI